MLLANSIELRPKKKQTEFLEKSIGCKRFVYNQCLAEWMDAYKRGRRPDKFYMRFYLSCLKDKYIWLKEVSDAPLQEAINDLVTAFDRFFKGLGGYPTFKKKGVNDSFSIRNMPKFKIVGRYLEIEKMRKSLIPMRERVRFEGQHRQVTIRKKDGKWFVSILIKMVVNPFAYKFTSNENQVGVDLGIKELAVLSDGMVFPANQELKKQLKKLKKLQRQLSKKVRGSNRYEKLRKKLQRLHYYISCKRKATLHKLTDYLTKTYKNITIEDLNVKGMLKNHKLAKAISDCGFGEFRRQLEYKAKFRNNRLTIANMFFPSSKICSSCGNKKDDLTLKDRVYICTCGLKIDRDLNAAINLVNCVGTDSSQTLNAQKRNLVTDSVDDVNSATDVVFVA